MERRGDQRKEGATIKLVYQKKTKKLCTCLSSMLLRVKQGTLELLYDSVGKAVTQQSKLSSHCTGIKVFS